VRIDLEELAGRLTAIPAALPATGDGEGISAVAVDHAARGFSLDVRFPSGQVVAVAEVLDLAGYALDTITGLDWPAEGEMELVYDFYHPVTGARVAARTRVPRSEPAVATIHPVFPGAAWHERETHDFFGIRFAGNPDLSPLLLPEDADFHPLRKDYAG
jgi:NADH-quinone oxidoreductase subunit C